MGVVYHSNHLIWFEVGRVELMREMGFPIATWRRKTIASSPWPKCDAATKRPRLYDEEIVIAPPEEHARVDDHFQYELVRADRQRRCWRKARPRTSSPIRNMKSRGVAGEVSDRFSARHREVGPDETSTGNS